MERYATVSACASPDTPIATPGGNAAIAALRAGDLVYSVDAGHVVAVPIVQALRLPVREHRVVCVTLAGGAVLALSPLHPTADGRLFADLRPGDALDGLEIRDVRVVPYLYDATYDILPQSDTGAYFAGGALIGSSLATGAERVLKPTVPLSAMR